MSDRTDGSDFPDWEKYSDEPMPLNLPYHSEVGKRLTVEEFGAYMLLLTHCWVHGRAPDDDAELAIICRAREASVWQRIAPAIRDEFVSENRFLYHPHLEWARSNGPDFAPPANRNLPDWRRLRQIVFQRDNFTCQYCFQTEVRLACDHVIPYSRGGATDLSNLVTACVTCNSSKRDMTPEEWKAWRSAQ